eukprot:CAMPEP_0170525692 /NCGR_PEP_ID=MMETSP0209-20121228/11147_1 /TAXON_ID=665100 ORGANISM="Litonotus pictus, Strain P1" /NCGR_SAMPLE_ID=MMETSP0209 /ASSEMBLY_ACC=CAM_ASM_000301 /LENGTH=82 /DNA_ID=CAMNT_0010815075 /DNA_START=174 /DNA_END=419 /DNA_ORIENTATION=+
MSSFQKDYSKETKQGRYTNNISKNEGDSNTRTQEKKGFKTAKTMLSMSQKFQKNHTGSNNNISNNANRMLAQASQSQRINGP